MPTISPHLPDRSRESIFEYPTGSLLPTRRAYVANTTSDPIPVSINPATTLTVDNLSVLLANTETSYAIPANTKKLLIKSRGKSKIQYSFVAGQSGTTYLTIWPGFSQEINDISLSGVTLYLQTSLAGEVIEILTWV